MEFPSRISFQTTAYIVSVSLFCSLEIQNVVDLFKMQQVLKSDSSS